METLNAFIAFAFVTLAAKQLGEFLTFFRLPLISGYLLAGIIAGPFMLDFIHTDTVLHLRFVDEISLAFIAFAAGSELHIEELKSRFKSIAWNIVGQVVIVYLLGTAAIVLLADFIPFMKDMPTASRIASAILVGSILIARSPSSAIAIVAELRAKGPFTKTILGVTIVMDVVVVIVFAISASVADVLLTAEGFKIEFVLLLAAELTISVILGYILGRVLELILSARLDQWMKVFLILMAGYAIFAGSLEFRDFTHDHFDFEVLFEPLLVCMLGSFWVTNFGQYRGKFLEFLEDIGPVVYVMFFTLVGDSLQLDILAAIWPIALVLFMVRLSGILIGSFSSGMMAGDPMLNNRLGWMCYITQAGVGLGLAKQAADEFPALGDEFATLIISVIVLTQLLGPPFFKFAIKRVGEAHLPGTPHPDDIRDVVVLGFCAQSLALARQLQAHHWKVIVADTDPSELVWFERDTIETRVLTDFSDESLDDLVTDATDAFVMMLFDDATNLKACELVYEHFGISRLIVRLNDFAWADQFAELGAKVIYPASAVVNLLDQFVRAPQSAEMFMHTEGHEITQITITDPDIHGLSLSKLRLPTDVLVLGIMRDGYSIIPHGYTILHQGDDITLLGSPESLEEVTLRLGF